MAYQFFNTDERCSQRNRSNRTGRQRERETTLAINYNFLCAFALNYLLENTGNDSTMELIATVWLVATKIFPSFGEIRYNSLSFVRQKDSGRGLARQAWD